MKVKQKSYLLLLALMFSLSGFVSAQEEQTSFNLNEAISYAMENSYVLHNTSQDITIAQRKVWETISTGLPQVSGSVDYNINIKTPKTPFPVGIIPEEVWPDLGIPADAEGLYPISFTQKYGANAGITLSQLIFDGSYIVGVGSAQLYLDLAKQAHEKTQIDIKDAVTQAYYMVLISQRNKEVMQENLDNTRDLYKDTKAYFDNGFRESQDVDQLRILVKSAENAVLSSERELSVAKVVLKYAMGYDLSLDIELESELNAFVDPLVQKQNSVQLDMANHIDYRLAVSNFQVSEKLLRLEKVSYLPSLSGFYSYTKTTYGNKANLFDESWFPSAIVGFQASIPIFNSGQKRSKVQQAQLELDKAATDQKLAEITLQKDYLTAKAEMETAREHYINDVESKDLAKSILDKSHIKFNNGMISSAELSQQESQYISAFQAMIASTLQMLQADINLRKAAGAL